ncbi:DEAD/DEAH box helicase [Pseudoclavibacter sp. RFBB5]|uniref:DEAD/DEAH box helicase n=1 Tax=Pseudoclavibacter sp. RFBB5 TaxID=2080574 RepID=UPI000CE897E6|nr:DEAD/DEAH box helicase [Pseudoclavibacter sp. RFBB5]PPG29012.1 DEAD/DEAH box helicase [Pseudoclavibacter sp. RFBB5]
MRETLRRWIADAETNQAIDDFRLNTRLAQLDYLVDRNKDLYYSLVGELFDMVRDGAADPADWASVGRGLDSVSHELQQGAGADALFFSSIAFYLGGFPASAVMTMRRADPEYWETSVEAAAYELLTRGMNSGSSLTGALLRSVRTGDLQVVNAAVATAEASVAQALDTGPEEWVAHRLYLALLQRFQQTNLRAVLPDGVIKRWDPLVESFLDRQQPVWDFFPSQIEAINAGLLTSSQSYSLQMPTGTGKTALTETLIFDHLTRSPHSKAVLLVPYRALARELRGSVGRYLTSMGLRSRTVYGGTVPGIEEREELVDVRVIIATPEALTGLIGAHPELLQTISLVVCDEGHLLDSGARGVGLELLLARLKARNPSPRIVFISAIVPNVEEINSWLGGSDATVVRSDYRPSIAEFAVLRPFGSGRTATIGLELHEPVTSVPSHTLPEFLRPTDFQDTNPITRRRNSYAHSSTKTRAVAAARKALALGPVAVFATEKGGNRGVVGLANELLKQIDSGLALPAPSSYVNDTQIVESVVAYLSHEFGDGWIGTRALHAGAIVHHGDIPQETREVLEELVSNRHVSMVLCTSTLAEGVNLPLRTMVLYSVKRSSDGRAPEAMLARDIKNLVGRAGRAGSSTRGLVICANPDDWKVVSPVAEGQPGEPVEGAVIELIRRLARALAHSERQLTNGVLEANAPLLPLVDGVDAALIELIRDELGEDEFIQIAENLADETFASAKANNNERAVLNTVFELRARRMVEMRSTGRLALTRTSSARPRLVDRVINDLLPRYERWRTTDSAVDVELIRVLVDWALQQPGFTSDAETEYRRTEITDLGGSLTTLVLAWLEGRSYEHIAERVGVSADTLLRIHAKVVMYNFVTLVEQAIALIQEHLAVTGDEALAPVIAALPDFLRFGVSTSAARELMARGMRHRLAAVALGTDPAMDNTFNNIFATPWSIARDLLADEDTWLSRLGTLVYRRTVLDVAVRRGT